MLQLWIKDKVPETGLLAFDLREVLQALGPCAMSWLWVVSDVGEGEPLEAVGPSLPDLEALELPGDRVSGSRLARVADGIDQVIWGEFRAYRDHGAAEPSVRVVAFDSSYYEVWSGDAALIGRVQGSFRDTTLNSPPVP